MTERTATRVVQYNARLCVYRVLRTWDVTIIYNSSGRVSRFLTNFVTSPVFRNMLRYVLEVLAGDANEDLGVLFTRCNGSVQ